MMTSSPQGLMTNEGNLAIFGYVAFEFLGAVAIKGILFWAVTPCSMRCYAGIYCLHFQDRRVYHTQSKQQENRKRELSYFQ